MGRRGGRRTSLHSPKGARSPLVLEPLKLVCVKVVCRSIQLYQPTYSTVKYFIRSPPLRSLGRPNAISAVSRKKSTRRHVKYLGIGEVVLSYGGNEHAGALGCLGHGGSMWASAVTSTKNSSRNHGISTAKSIQQTSRYTTVSL